MDLTRFPRETICHLPTPLEHAPRLSRVVIEGTLDRATRGKVRTLTSALEKRALAARAHRR